MIQPKQIIKVISKGKGYLLQRCFGEEERPIDSTHDTIESISPFVVVSGERRIIFTSKANIEDYASYDYVALTRRKPSRTMFNRDEIEIISWIKHPLFGEETPEVIVESWGDKFCYRKESSNHDGLRQPQLAATHAFLANETEKQRRIIVMPTGTGKVVVTSMTLLANCSSEVLDMMKASFSNVFVDEAHHSEAATWDNVISSFSPDKVTLFTATPFRNDGKRLSGKFIYTFSLKEAQKQGYYKRINYCPVREYDPQLADKHIAEKAIEILRRDRENGHDHILMARCATIKRANEIFKYYEECQDLSPVIVSSKTLGHKQIVEEIKRKEHKIIVCVNMLGEGFDLPEMKIAAIHDQRQSIPVTLQFVGRFTRESSRDALLGEASFVANIASTPVKKELEDMYSQDADWNILLPEMNDQLTEEEVDFSNFISSFNCLSNSNIAIQKINIPLSAVIYRTTSKELRANDWKKLYPEDRYQYRFSTTSGDGKTLLIILGNVEAIDWGSVESVQNIVWNLIVVHREVTPKYTHAYFYSTCNENYKELADALFGGVNQKIDGGIIFRVFHNVKRFLTVNFGGRNKGDISFKSFYGKDVENAIGEIEKKRLVKNNIFGNGYWNGDRISLGCSTKGKIWSFMRGNLLMYSKWVRRMGALIEDSSIDEDEIWKNTLKPSKIEALPDVEPICVDWDADVYAFADQRIGVSEVNGSHYAFWDIELNLLKRDDTSIVKFELRTPSSSAEFGVKYGKEISGDRNYLVEQISGLQFAFMLGNQTYDDIVKFFNEEYPPTINFADGSQLYGDTLTASSDGIKLFDRNRLEDIDWKDVNIKKESMHVPPYETDSIQYFIADKINKESAILSPIYRERYRFRRCTSASWQAPISR